MRRYALTSLAVIIITLAATAQSKAVKKPTAEVPRSASTAAKTNGGYNIPITLTPFKNTWVYLGCYFGKYKN
ncbi:MAG: hypothetical protein M3040_16955, partial [Bacteroidota bacterium]|nr:hypothetical protein [Bacteroidota bacterium]